MAVYLSRVGYVPKQTHKVKDLPIGSIIYVYEDSVLTPYMVAEHSYEPEINSRTDLTLLVRSYACSTTCTWGDSNDTVYYDSTLRTNLEDMYGNYDSKTRAAIQEDVLIRCTSVANTTELANVPSTIFTPSITELGLTPTYGNEEGTALSGAGRLLISYTISGTTLTAVAKWTRTAETSSTSYAAITCSTAGAIVRTAYSASRYVLPCFCVKETAELDSTSCFC